MYTKVRSILVSYFIHMRLNSNGSFGVKQRTLTKLFIKLIFFKIHNVNSHMNKLTKMERTLATFEKTYFFVLIPKLEINISSHCIAVIFLQSYQRTV